MEDMSPSLTCLYHVKTSLDLGHSLRSSLRLFIAAHNTAFSFRLLKWVNHIENGQMERLQMNWESEYQATMIQIFEAGLQGQPILESLSSLIEEVELASQLEVDEFIALLPFKALIPLFVFQFPAFLVLIFGPVLKVFMEGLSQ